MVHPTQFAPLVGGNLTLKQTMGKPSHTTKSYRSTAFRTHNIRFGRSSVSAGRSVASGASNELRSRAFFPVLSRNRIHQQQTRIVSYPKSKTLSRRGHLSITAAGFTTTDADTLEKPLKVLPIEVVEEATTGWQRRYVMIGLCFLAFLLCNMDRVNMSIAIIDMKDEFNWDSSTMGVVQSSFFWGYLLTQVCEHGCFT